MRVPETGDRQRNHHHQGAIDRNPYQSVASQPQSPKQRKIMHNKLTRSDVAIHLTLPYTSG